MFFHIIVHLLSKASPLPLRKPFDVWFLAFLYPLDEASIFVRPKLLPGCYPSKFPTPFELPFVSPPSLALYLIPFPLALKVPLRPPVMPLAPSFCLPPLKSCCFFETKTGHRTTPCSRFSFFDFLSFSVYGVLIFTFSILLNPCFFFLDFPSVYYLFSPLLNA